MSALAQPDDEGTLPIPAEPLAEEATAEDRLRERRARIALSLVTEPGDAEVGLNVQRWGAVQAWQRVRAESGKARELTADSVHDQLRRAEAVGASCVIPGDPQWPSQLDDLGSGTPLLLWVRGNPVRTALLRSVAIVGARSCTRYGRAQAETLASDLALRGWTVVSGGAFGIDAAAHVGAMAVGGVTVAAEPSGKVTR